VVVINAVRHFLVEVPRFAGRHLLHVDWGGAARTVLVAFENGAVIGTVPDFGLLNGIH
jgi:hypothetical protein